MNTVQSLTFGRYRSRRDLADWALATAMILSLLLSSGSALGFPQAETQDLSSKPAVMSADTESKADQGQNREEVGEQQESVSEWNPDAAFGTDPDYVIGRFVFPAVIFLIAVLALSLVVIFREESETDQERIYPFLRQQKSEQR